MNGGGSQSKMNSDLSCEEIEITAEMDDIGIPEFGMNPVLPHKDFLIAFSTLPGFYSFRNNVNGSWFIQELCQELNENDGSHHLLSVLTNVKRTIAYDYESTNANNSNLDQKKQISCVMSMLTKLVFFPKPNSQTESA